MKTNQKGFTLIELLIVIAIISLLATTLLPSLSGARAKGDDARRKVTLKSLQSQIALQTDTGVAGYSNIFSTNGDTKAKLDELVSQTGVAGSDYDARSDATSYAVVFPLKANPSKYWCIDASGVSKEVSGRLASSGTPSCGNIVAPTVGNPPVFTFNGGDFFEEGLPTTGICTSSACLVKWGINDHAYDPYTIANIVGAESETDPRITEYQINQIFIPPIIPQAMSASDVEDGDLSDQIEEISSVGVSSSFSAATAAAQNIITQAGGGNYTFDSCNLTFDNYVEKTFSVTDSNGNTTLKVLKVYACTFH